MIRSCSAPRYEDSREKTLDMEAEHVKRIRALMPFNACEK